MVHGCVKGGDDRLTFFHNSLQPYIATVAASRDHQNMAFFVKHSRHLDQLENKSKIKYSNIPLQR